jgi:hypothetical protein
MAAHIAIVAVVATSGMCADKPAQVEEEERYVERDYPVRVAVQCAKPLHVDLGAI